MKASDRVLLSGCTWLYKVVQLTIRLNVSALSKSAAIVEQHARSCLLNCLFVDWGRNSVDKLIANCTFSLVGFVFFNKLAFACF